MTGDRSEEIPPDDVRAFYDGFLRSRMLEYRLNGNPRISSAQRRLLHYVSPDSVVLDLGCGIGLVTEAVAEKAALGLTVGCDISESNIWYARQTVRAPNVRFVACDILREPDALREWAGRFDVIGVVDVIEHLPLAWHPEFFATLKQIAADSCALVLTYPSPNYQRYLKAREPAELQIVDEVVEPEVLIANAAAAGFTLQHYSLEDVWLREQYVHCVFGTDRAGILDPQPTATPWPQRIRRVAGKAVSTIMRPLRRRKYISRVFRARND